MSTDKILKKDALLYRKSALNVMKGNLILTQKELYFTYMKGLIKKTEETAITIAVTDIINVKSLKPFGGYGIDRLEITHTAGGKETKTTFEHQSIYGYAIGAINAAQKAYFDDWAVMIEDLRKGKSQSGGLDELEKLAQLKDKGIITKEEFEAKKKQLLNL